MYISTEWTLPLCCRSCCILVPITIYTASSISFVQVDLALTRSSRSCWPWLPNRQYCLPVHCRSWGSISRSGQGKPYPCPLQHQASRGMTLCGMRLQLQPASWQRQGRMGYRASSASYWTAPGAPSSTSFEFHDVRSAPSVCGNDLKPDVVMSLRGKPVCPLTTGAIIDLKRQGVSPEMDKNDGQALTYGRHIWPDLPATAAQQSPRHRDSGFDGFENHNPNAREPQRWRAGR